MKQRSHRRMGALICLVILSTAAVVLLAKYVTTFLGNFHQVTSEVFYFSTNLTGDPTMVNNTDAAKMRAYLEDRKNGTWSLYGGGNHSVNILVCNYLDDLRISQEDINYTVELSGQVPSSYDSAGHVTDYEAMSESELSKLATLTPPLDETRKETLTAKMEGEEYEKCEACWTLFIASAEDCTYVDDTLLTVTIKSTKPYRASIVLQFVLFTTDPQYSYRILKGSNYYEMIIMAESAIDSLTVNWAKGLAIDHTNPLTYTGAFEQMPVTGGEEEGYSMTLSRSIKAGESVSLLFFITDETKSFSVNTTTEKIPITEEKDTDLCPTLTKGDSGE